MEVSLVIPTFEPKFEISDRSQTLWKFIKKFQILAAAKRSVRSVELRLLIVDCRSSADLDNYSGNSPIKMLKLICCWVTIRFRWQSLKCRVARETVDADLCAYVSLPIAQAWIAIG